MTTTCLLSSEITGGIAAVNHDQQTNDIRNLDANKFDKSGGALSGAIVQAYGIHNQTANLDTADLLSDFVASGFATAVPNPASLTLTLSPGVAYVGGVRLAKTSGQADLTHTFDANVDAYIDMSNTGALTYSETSNNNTPPAQAAGTLRIAKVVTNASAITSITVLNNSVNILSNTLSINNHPVWTAENMGAGSGLDTDLVRGVNPDSLYATRFAQSNITGGGNLTWINSYFSWQLRFKAYGAGEGSHYSTDGYFDIAMPAIGVSIKGYSGASDRAVTSSGIFLTAWEVLYYIPPIGSGSASVDANFAIVGSGSSFIVPHHWLMVAAEYGDTKELKVCIGVLMSDGQTWTYGQGQAQRQGDASVNFSVADAVLPTHAVSLRQADKRYLAANNTAFTGRLTVNTTDDSIHDVQIGGTTRLDHLLTINGNSVGDHLTLHNTSGTANEGVNINLTDSNGNSAQLGLDGHGALYFRDPNNLRVDMVSGYVYTGADSYYDNASIFNISGIHRKAKVTQDSGSHTNYFYPLATVDITAQGGMASFMLEVSKIGSNDGSNLTSHGFISVRVNQINAMAQAPQVEMTTSVSTGLKPSNFSFVVSVNNSSHTTGTLYIKVPQTNEKYNYAIYNPFIKNATLTEALNNTAGLSSLPAGTVFNPSTTCFLTQAGNFILGKELDDGNQLQVSGSGSFGGYVYATTAANGDSSNKLATTSFVQNAVASYNTSAMLSSPVFTGNPTAPTPLAGNNSASLATTEFVTRDFLSKGSNLSGLTNPATARSNLGLSALATDNPANYVKTANNLSDLANASTARSNLGLGDMAVQNSNNVTITGGSISGINSLSLSNMLLGVGTAATGASFTSAGKMAIQAGSTVSLLIGADNTGNTITDAVLKKVRIAVPHYHTASAPVALIHASSDNGSNTVDIGGGSTEMNAATAVRILAAQTSATSVGSEVVRFTAARNGVMIMGGISDNGQDQALFSGSIKASKFTGDVNGGNGSFSGTFSVTNAVNLSGTVSVGGTSTFSGASTFNSSVSAQSLTTTGNASVGGTLTATGGVQFASGKLMANVLYVSRSITIPALNSGAKYLLNISLSGAVAGAPVLIGKPDMNSAALLTLTAEVSSAGNLQFLASNPYSSASSAFTGTFNFYVLSFS